MQEAIWSLRENNKTTVFLEFPSTQVKTWFTTDKLKELIRNMEECNYDSKKIDFYRKGLAMLSEHQKMPLPKQTVLLISKEDMEDYIQSGKDLPKADHLILVSE